MHKLTFSDSVKCATTIEITEFLKNDKSELNLNGIAIGLVVDILTSLDWILDTIEYDPYVVYMWNFKDIITIHCDKLSRNLTIKRQCQE